jgi:UDP-3-O-[3-hydroxymyristoyl] glucosamine N-acyltransferase
MTLADVANAVDARLVGDGNLPVRQLVHPRQVQSPEDMAFILDPSAITALQNSPVVAAVVPEGVDLPDGVFKGYLAVKRPRVALAKLLDLFNKPVHAQTGIHPSAVVHSTAKVSSSASVGAFAYVGPEARVGERTVLMPHVTVGAQAQVGDDCLFHPGARIGERVMIGSRVIIQHNASIGGDGFSYVTPEAGSVEAARNSGGQIEAQNTEIIRINSVGTVILEDDVEVGACATIDRANLGATHIKKGTKIDNLVMIGHNNTVGENCLIVSQVGVSGSCTIGNRVVIAGQAGIADHLTIGDDSIIMAQAGVTKSCGNKSLLIGSPAVPRREFAQTLAHTNRLKQMADDLKQMKQRVEALEKELANQLEAETASVSH